MQAADHLSCAHEQAVHQAEAHDTMLAEMTLAHETATAQLKKEVRLPVPAWMLSQILCTDMDALGPYGVLKNYLC